MKTKKHLVPFPNGSIKIELDRTQYFCQEIITGTIHLKLTSPFPSTLLKLEFKGYEKERIVLKNQQNALPENSKKETTRFMVNQYSLQTIPSNDMNTFPVGEYFYRFEVKLGNLTKPSFNHSCQNNAHSTYATIKHHLRAFLSNPNTILETKQSLMIYSSTHSSNPETSVKKTFELKGIKSLFRNKSTTLYLDLQQKAFDMQKDNLIFVNVDTRESHAAPRNLKLMLINYVSVRGQKSTSICRNVVWENTITSKLIKGTNYSGQNGFVLKIPSLVFKELFQTTTTPFFINAFVLRLCYDVKQNSSEQHSVLLPIEFFRASLPKTPVTGSCLRSLKLPTEYLIDIDQLFANKPLLMQKSQEGMVSETFVVPSRPSLKSIPFLDQQKLVAENQSNYTKSGMSGSTGNNTTNSGSGPGYPMADRRKTNPENQVYKESAKFFGNDQISRQGYSKQS